MASEIQIFVLSNISPSSCNNITNGRLFLFIYLFIYLFIDIIVKNLLKYRILIHKSVKIYVNKMQLC